MTGAWSDQIPEPEWVVYARVLGEFRRRQIPFALGGAFGLAAYTGRWRNTKDLDLYVMPETRERAWEAVLAAGLEDYHLQKPYDRGWIRRGELDGTIVDVIWAMANRKSEVDALWLLPGPMIMIRDRAVRVLPAEELLWAKLYVMQRERCDWPDLLNLIAAAGERMDWEHLLGRLGQDRPLLQALLSIYAWVHPAMARRLPVRLWSDLGLAGVLAAQNGETHAHLLDSRPWFGPLLEPVACLQGGEGRC